MKEEKQTKMKKSTKYLLIGTLVLFLSVLGASMAYYLARVSGNLSGRAAGTELAINVEKISSNATGDLIPLDNDLETLNLAAAGYDNKGACVDINGYSVCQIYHITLTNNGSVPLTVNGTVTLSGQNVPNIDCARMDNATTVSNNNSCMGGNVFVSGDTLSANEHRDYYVMVYIKNLDEPQTDSGEFNGTVTFTTEDGKKVKGRFTKPFNLVKHIEELYDLNGGTTDNKTAKSIVTNNEIEYNYATNVGLMNDRLGGTTASLDGGNIRYYGVEPNNYIDIGDKYETDVKNYELLEYESSEQCHSDYNNHEENRNIDCAANWENWDYESEEACYDDYGNWWVLGYYGVNTVEEACDGIALAKGTPILWRIIGVFDGKLRVRRDESIGTYSWDKSASNVNAGNGINEWSQADLMKLLNPGYETNQDFDSDGETLITVNNSLYWNSASGNCYGGFNNNCDFTNTGLSDETKEYVIDQTLYLGGFDTMDVFANQAYTKERGANVLRNPEDGVPRTTSWKGKVGLIYPSDYGYAADFSDSNCQGDLSSFYDDTNGVVNCTANWMVQGYSWTVSPWSEAPFIEIVFYSGSFSVNYTGDDTDVWPTLLLDSSVLAESGNGSKETPYVVAY